MELFSPEWYESRRYLFEQPMGEAETESRTQLGRAFKRSGQYETGGFLSALADISKQYAQKRATGLGQMGLEEAGLKFQKGEADIGRELQKYLLQQQIASQYSLQQLVGSQREKELALQHQYSLEEAEAASPGLGDFLLGIVGTGLGAFAGGLGGAASTSLTDKIFPGQKKRRDTEYELLMKLYKGDN